MIRLILRKHILLSGILVTLALVGFSEDTWGRTGWLRVDTPANNTTISGNTFNSTLGYSVSAPSTAITYSYTYTGNYIFNCNVGSSHGSLEYLDYYNDAVPGYILGTIKYKIDNSGANISVADVRLGNNTAKTANLNVTSLSSGLHTANFSMYRVYSERCGCGQCHTGSTVGSPWVRKEESTPFANTTLSFNVIRPVTAAPILVSPVSKFFTGSTSTTTAGFSWGPVPNASSYKLDIRDASTGSLVQEGTPAITSFNSISLQPMKKYSWQVAGVNSVTPTGPFSETRQFIVAECWPEVGTGNGYAIDTCYNGSNYLLRDISRRANLNVGGHNGNMSDNASIITKSYQAISPLSNAVNDWTQVSAVDAHKNTAKVYDYLNSKYQDQYRFYVPPPSMISNILSQNVLASMVESEDDISCPQDFAFYNPDVISPITVEFCKGTLASSSLDIVGHEWAHTLTDLASNHGLLRNREAGTLNEAFSDWMATAIKHANNDNSWIITISADLNRNLFNPLLSKPVQPTWYDGTNWKYCSPSELPNRDNDYCGVHQNTGVPNQMFYLLSQAIGIEKAIQIAYKANMERWKTNLTFVDARDGMIWAAGQLYGLSVAAQVDQAWAAVGVSPTSTLASLTAKRLIQILTGLLLND